MAVKAGTADSLEQCVEQVIGRVGPRLVLGTPLGIGKCNALINAFYQRACRDADIHLRIITALSLSVPQPGSDLERRFLEPLARRLWPDYPELDYVSDLLADRLPANVEVLEFYFPPGRMLGAPAAQRNYISSNYTHVCRDMLAHGVNVMAQAVAVRGSGETLRYSLSCNPDVTLDLVPQVRRREAAGGAPAVVIGVVNRRLPFMGSDAEVTPDFFDTVLDVPAGTHEPFAMPASAVSVADHAIGVHAAALIPDGGTLQIGIGSLGDAVVHGCCLRQTANAAWKEARQRLGAADGLAEEVGGTQPFATGLYGASEMFVEGFLTLCDNGVLRRHVYDDPWLERWQELTGGGPVVSRELLEWLVAEGVMDTPLTLSDMDWLINFGVFREGVSLRDGFLHTPDGQRIAADLEDPASLAAVEAHCLGSRLRGGRVLQAGFFLGSQRFYERLRQLPEALHDAIQMTAIGEVNRLSGDRELETRQRRGARFFNAAMKMTIIGAAVSDGLDDGSVVSGVGGQFDFVSLAHKLPDGRSVLMLRSTRRNSEGQRESNIVPAYGHITIPRHLRDMVITEYGVADLRSCTDSEIIKRLLCICDAEFQPGLLAWAKKHGKIEADYALPGQCRNNTPAHLARALEPLRARGLLPEYPLGTDFTDEEQVLARALTSLKAATGTRLGLLRTLLRAARPGAVPASADACLARMGLARPGGLRERLLRRLVGQALAQQPEITAG